MNQENDVMMMIYISYANSMMISQDRGYSCLHILNDDNEGREECQPSEGIPSLQMEQGSEAKACW